MTFSFYSNGLQYADGGSGDLPENVVTTDGAQTLTNKTISAPDNNILNLDIANFKADLVREIVRDVENASNDKLVTEKAVAQATNTYVHDQALSSNTWVVEHNLGKYPSVTVVDSAGTQFIVQVEYNSKNKLTIYMNGATTGKAYLN